MQEVKLSEKEVINKWMEVFESEQKSGQKQWTHLVITHPDGPLSHRGPRGLQKRK